MTQDQQGMFSSAPQELEPEDDNGKKREKVTIYLSPKHILKLDSLVYEYNRKTRGKRVNRNQVVRHLIDQCTVESLKDLHSTS